MLRQDWHYVVNKGTAYRALFCVPDAFDKGSHAITTEDQVIAGSDYYVARVHHAHCALEVLRHIVGVEFHVSRKPLQSIELLLDVAC